MSLSSRVLSESFCSTSSTSTQPHITRYSSSRISRRANKAGLLNQDGRSRCSRVARAAAVEPVASPPWHELVSMFLDILMLSMEFGLRQPEFSWTGLTAAASRPSAVSEARAALQPVQQGVIGHHVWGGNQNGAGVCEVLRCLHVDTAMFTSVCLHLQFVTFVLVRAVVAKHDVEQW